MGFEKKTLSLKQKVYLVKHYYEKKGDVEGVGEEFQKAFETTTANLSETIYKLITAFENLGSITRAFHYEFLDGYEEEKEVIYEDIIVKDEDASVKDEDTDSSNGHCDDDYVVEVLPEDPEYEDEILEVQLTVKKEPMEKKEPVTRKRRNKKQTPADTSVDPKKPLLCKECGKFYSKSVYYQHIKLHKPVGDYECEICHRKFKLLCYLKEHIIRHKPKEERGNHQCDLCGKKSVSKSEHNSHMKSHSTVRDHVCSTCGKAFVRLQHFKRHMRIHTGEKPFKCAHCDKSFGTHTAHQIHTRTHTGERPYSCPYCDKKFIGASARNVHLKQNHEEYQHRCSICNKRFKFSHILEAHIAQFHPVELLMEKDK